eukprot:375697_1
MSALLLQQQQQIQKQYKVACSKSLQDFISFFADHQQDILSGSSWFFQELICRNNVEAMKYILQHYDLTEHMNKKMGLNAASHGFESRYPLDFVCCSGTLEMLRLIIPNGAEPDDINKNYCSHLIATILCSCFTHNSGKIKGDDVYLSIQYLLNHIRQNSEIQGIVTVRLAEAGIGNPSIANPRHDPIEIAKLIENKISFIKRTMDSRVIQYAIHNKNFKFLEFVIDEYGVDVDGQISPNMYGYSSTDYVDKDKIEWLLKHNGDINGFMSEGVSCADDKITPLFNRCIHKKYDEVEYLLDFGADINKQCIYKQQKITPLQFIIQTFPKDFAELFQNYKINKSEDKNKLLGFDFSNIQATAYNE